MHRALRSSLVVLVLACGSSSDSDSLPAAAEAMRTYLKAGVTLIIPRLGGVGAVFPFALNPGSPAASGIQFDPDPSPGAPPNSYIFTLNYDGDGDGTQETTFAGTVGFNEDPANAGDGIGGHVVLTMQSAGGLGTLTGEMDFTVTPGTGGEVSGTGTFTEAVTGNSTYVTVPQAAPLHIEMARGTSDSRPNACASSLDGSVGLDVVGPSGTLSSIWVFDRNRTPARLTNALFADTQNETTRIPDQDVTIPCGQGSDLSDWAGVFQEYWACAPAEFGHSELTLSVSGGHINVSDEDPPASGDIDTYQASPLAGNPHVLRGFFIGGETGSTYREDFSWLLNDDGDSFSQISRYVYLEGPNQGQGGYCAARVTR